MNFPLAAQQQWRILGNLRGCDESVVPLGRPTQDGSKDGGRSSYILACLSKPWDVIRPMDNV
jgi:hypothetical protein